MLPTPHAHTLADWSVSGNLLLRVKRVSIAAQQDFRLPQHGRNEQLFVAHRQLRYSNIPKQNLPGVYSGLDRSDLGFCLRSGGTSAQIVRLFSSLRFLSVGLRSPGRKVRPATTAIDRSAVAQAGRIGQQASGPSRKCRRRRILACLTIDARYTSAGTGHKTPSHRHHTRRTSNGNISDSHSSLLTRRAVAQPTRD